jgi:hypothetical protein
MADTIGTVRVELIADPSGITEGIRSAGAALTRFAAIGSTIGNLLSAGFQAAASALARSLGTAIEEVTKLADAADRLDITTREMQTLAAAAEQSGVSFKQLTEVAGNFGLTLATGLRTATSDVSQSLRILGVEVLNADGSMRTFADLLPQLADGFARYADGANKDAIAAALFGRAAGPQLAAFLSQGSEAIEAQRRQLEQTLPRYDVTAIQNFENANKALQAAISKLAIEFGQFGAGPAARVVEQLTLLVKFLNEFAGSSGPRAAQVMTELSAATAEFARIQERLAASGIMGSLARGMDSVTGQASAALLDVQNRIDRLRSELQRLVAPDLQPAVRPNAPADPRPQAPGIIGDLESLASRARRVFEQTRTPLELINVEIAKLNTLFQAGAIDADTFGRAVEMAKERITGVRQTMISIGEAMSSAFADAILGAKSFGDAMRDLMNQVARMMLNRVFMQLLLGSPSGVSATQGGPLGGVLGSILGSAGSAFDGFRASGGPVSAGRSYIVGERGPELFTPLTAGEIIPGDAIGGRGDVKVTIINTIADADVSARRTSEEDLEITVRGLVRDELGSGRTNAVMANKYGLRPRVRSR